MKLQNGTRRLTRVGISISTFIVLMIWLWFLVTDLPTSLKPSKSNPPAVLFDNVRVLSMEENRPELKSLQAVLVVGKTIEQVAAAGEIEAPKGSLVIDGRGHTLMPGLIDAHIHLNDQLELAAYLAHGVTGVRNMSGFPFHLRLIDQIAQGKLLSPDFITTGPMLNSPGPNVSILQTTLSTAEEAQRAVQNQYDAGYRHIKVYSNLTQDVFDAILNQAALLQMTVSGHSPEGVRTSGIPYKKPFDIPWETTLGRGLVTLEHIETIVWHGLRDDLDRNKMGLLAMAIAESGEAVTPTLYAHQRLVLIAQSKGTFLTRPGSDMINPLVTWFTEREQQYWSGVDPSVYEKPHADFFLTATGLLHESGVPLLTGTDSGSFGIIPGASVTRELQLLVAAGLSPFEALNSATRRNAETLGFEKTGMVLPGYRANLILLPKDPLTDINVVEFPVGVMIGGHWLDQKTLDDLKHSARTSGVSSFLRSLVHVIEMKLSS